MSLLCTFHFCLNMRFLCQNTMVMANLRTRVRSGNSYSLLAIELLWKVFSTEIYVLCVVMPVVISLFLCALMPVVICFDHDEYYLLAFSSCFTYFVSRELLHVAGRFQSGVLIVPSPVQHKIKQALLRNRSTRLRKILTKCVYSNLVIAATNKKFL
jgi:hypothetical protein